MLVLIISVLDSMNKLPKTTQNKSKRMSSSPVYGPYNIVPIVAPMYDMMPSDAVNILMHVYKSQARWHVVIFCYTSTDAIFQI